MALLLSLAIHAEGTVDRAQVKLKPLSFEPFEQHDVAVAFPYGGEDEAAIG